MTWKQINTKRLKYERRYKRKVYNALMAQLADVLGELNIGNVTVITEKINTIVSNNLLKKTFYDIYNDTGWDFYREQIFQKGIEDVERSLWDETFQKVIEAETGMRITMITDYSKELLQNLSKDILRRGQEQGLGIYEMERMMRRELTDEFRRMSRYRSLRIVQTEVMSASNFATMKAGENSGLSMRKVWMTAPMGLAKNERHTLYEPDLGRQRPAKGEPFRFGQYEMQYPGDPNGGAENVINCRCALSWEPVENSIL